ncbi:MAG: hypothetical protein GY953_30330 [bacterium]|nr:hypothetical protein [bacterium]
MRLAVCLLISAPLAAQDYQGDALLRVRTMAKVLDRVDDSRLAVSGLARLGRVVCQHDYETAHYVFETGAARQQQAAYRGSLAAWQELIAPAAGCDDALAAGLAASVEIRKPRIEWLESEIRAAWEDLEDEPREAASRMEPAVPFFRELSVGGQEDFVAFLVELWLEEEETADRMFLDAVRYLRLDPAGALPALFVLGNYPYTSPDGALTPVAAGGIEVYDLTIERPESAPDSAWFYLLAVGDALAIPADDPNGAVRRFFLAHQLYPRVERLSERLADLYRAHLEQAAAKVPPALTAFAEERLNPVVAPPDQPVELARFGVIREYLRQGDLDTAFALTRDAPPGVKRALLYLSFAAVTLDAGDEIRSAQMLQLAAREHDRSSRRHRPWLWTMQAGLQVTIELDGAFTALSQAVKTWNEWDTSPRYGDHPAIRPTAIGFVERAGSADGVRQFLLRVPGVERHTFTEVLPAFGQADLDRVDAILAGLKNPDRRVDAQINAIAVRLAEAFAPGARQ